VTWQVALCQRVGRELARHGLDAWLLHVDRLTEQRAEVALNGTSQQRGESACLSLALWRGGRMINFSFLFAPARPQDVCARVAAALANLNAVSWRAGVRPPLWREGVWHDSLAAWDVLARDWSPHLRKSIRRAGAGAQQLELCLERREIHLQDERDRTRQVVRHAARLTLSCRCAARPGAWTMTVPLDASQPHDLTPHIARGIQHARLRACRTQARAGCGVVLLQPTAVAQLLSASKTLTEVDQSAGDLLACTRPGHPSIAFDDLGVPIQSADQRSASAPLWFAHRAALPDARPEHIWIPRGELLRRIERDSLLVRHFDEILTEQSGRALPVIASGEQRTSRALRHVAGVRLGIPLRRMKAACADAACRGDSLRSIYFGGVSYHVPALALGELSWQPA